MPKTDPFDNYSDEYDEWFEKNHDIYEAELAAIRLVLPPAVARGVEIGVGSGKFAVSLGITIGVEPSEEMARRARERERGVTVYPGVAEHLPFSDGEFDFVLMVTTICFVDDIARSFSEAFRVLKVGGCIIVGFVDRDSELGSRYQEKRAESRFYRVATFFSTPEVLHYLKETGFGAVEIRQVLVPGETTETIRDGFGAGAFVVIRSEKIEPLKRPE